MLRDQVEPIRPFFVLGPEVFALPNTPTGLNFDMIEKFRRFFFTETPWRFAFIGLEDSTFCNMPRLSASLDKMSMRLFPKLTVFSTIPLTEDINGLLRCAFIVYSPEFSAKFVHPNGLVGITPICFVETLMLFSSNPFMEFSQEQFKQTAAIVQGSYGH